MRVRLTSVRLRLTLWNIGMLAVALLTLILAMKDSVEQKIVASVDQDLRREVDRVAAHYRAMYDPRVVAAFEANRDRITALFQELQRLHRLLNRREAQW